MTQNAHTPGPWKVDPDPEGEPHGIELHSAHGYFALVEGEDRTGPDPTPETVDAGARLIASAPELLEAARLVLSGWDKVGAMDPEGADALRAAIQKATGEDA